MNYNDQIHEIMDYFNFSRVALAMEALNWTWGSAGMIPDEPTIRQSARKYLTQVSELGNGYSVGSGGFIAHKDDDGYLSLRFELDSWDTNPDN